MTAASCRARQSSNIRASPVPSGGCGLFDEWPRGITQFVAGCAVVMRGASFERRIAVRATAGSAADVTSLEPVRARPAIGWPGRQRRWPWAWRSAPLQARSRAARTKRTAQASAKRGERRRTPVPPWDSVAGAGVYEATPAGRAIIVSVCGGGVSATVASARCSMDLSGRRGAPPRDELP